MIPVVLDACVCVKWALPESSAEPHIDHARALLSAVGRGDVTLIEPPHWLAEVMAVLARHPGVNALTFLSYLDAVPVETEQGLDVYAIALQLAQELQHHLFDTLYHAVALSSPDRVFVTADDKYYRKASSRGQVMRLSDWRG